MIHELEKEHFHRCASLVIKDRHIEVQAIVSGVDPGRIYVDDPAAPRSAMIWQGNLDGFSFLGDPTNDAFNQAVPEFVEQAIAPDARRLGLGWFEGYGHHPRWDATIEKMLLTKSRQNGFKTYT